MQVSYGGTLSEAVRVAVNPFKPVAFTVDQSGSGSAAVLNTDGTVNAPNNPAQPGSYISIYGTGGGQKNPPGSAEFQVSSRTRVQHRSKSDRRTFSNQRQRSCQCAERALRPVDSIDRRMDDPNIGDPSNPMTQDSIVEPLCSTAAPPRATILPV
jgi:hypothetical protein